MTLRRRQRGTTLVEMVVSIVILSIASTGILMVMTQNARYSADPMLREQAVAIAQAYMEEILLRPSNDPDGSSGESSRALFDDIWDYQGLNDNAGAVDQSGTPIAGLEGYNIQVAIDSGGVTFGGSAATRIRVTVSHDGHSGINMPITAYRIN